MTILDSLSTGIFRDLTPLIICALIGADASPHMSSSLSSRLNAEETIPDVEKIACSSNYELH